MSGENRSRRDTENESKIQVVQIDGLVRIFYRKKLELFIVKFADSMQFC